MRYSSLWFLFTLLWWLVIFSIFSYIYWPSVCPLWKNVYSGPLSIFNWVVCFLGLKLSELVNHYTKGKVLHLWFMVNTCILQGKKEKLYIKEGKSHGLHGSVDWVPAYKPKGCWLYSQSGHMAGLWARSPVGGAREATTHWCFSPSLSPSLPLSLKINK